MIRSALTIAGKELQVLFRDRGTLAVMFLLPLVLASLFGSMAISMAPSEGEQAVTLPVGILNDDSGPYGEQITTILGGIKSLELVTLESEEQANEKVASRAVLAAIVIPADLSARVEAYEPSTVEVIIDPTQEQYSSLITGIMNDVVAPVVLQGEIKYGIRTVMNESGLYEDISAELRRATEAQTLGVIMTQLQKLQASPWISVRKENLEGVEEEGGYNPFSYNMPSFAVMFAFFLVGTMAQSVWLEKEQGSFRRLLAAPIHRGSIIGGKMLAYMLVVCLQVLVFFTIGNAVFDMPLGNSPSSLVLLTLSLALASAGLGMLIAALARNSRQADSLGMVLGFVLAAAGGCLFPLFRLGGVIGFISRLTPHAHAIMGFWGVFEGATLADILPRVVIVGGMGVAFLLVAIWKFRFV